MQSVLLTLKMLYLSDYRDLQNDVNALVVTAQEFTANPFVKIELFFIGLICFVSSAGN